MNNNIVGSKGTGPINDLNKPETETSPLTTLSQTILGQEQVPSLDLTVKKVKPIPPEITFLKDLITSFNDPQIQVAFEALSEENQSLISQFYFSLSKYFPKYYKQDPIFGSDLLKERLDALKKIQENKTINDLLVISLNHSWKILTLDKALFLIDNGHVEQLKRLLLFANDLDKYESRELILRSYFYASQWDPKYGTNLFDFVHDLFAYLDRYENEIVDIFTDRQAAVAWCTLTLSCNYLKQRFLKTHWSKKQSSLKKDFLKSDIISQYRLHYRYEKDGLHCSRSSLIEVTPVGTKGGVNYTALKLNNIENLFLNPQLLQRLLPFANRYSKYIIDLIDASALNASLLDRFLRILESYNSPQQVQTALAILDLTPLNHSLYLDVIEHPNWNSKFLSAFSDKIIAFTEKFPQQKGMLLKLLKHHFTQFEKLEKSTEKYNTLSNQMDQMMNKEQRRDISMEFKKERIELNKLRETWIVKPLNNGKTIVENLLTGNNNIRLMDGIDLLLQSGNESLIGTFMNRFNDDRQNTLNLLDVIDHEIPEKKGNLLASLVTLIEKNHGLACRLFTYSKENPEVFEVIKLLGGLYEKPLDENRILLCINWAESNPKTAKILSESRFKTYLEGSNATNIPKIEVSKILEIIKTQPETLNRLTDIFMMNIFLNGLAKKDENKRFLFNLTGDVLNFSWNETTLYKTILNMPELTVQDRCYLENLIGYQGNVFIKKLLNLFKTNPTLARKLLIYAAETYDLKLPSQILNLMSRPKMSPIPWDKMLKLILPENVKLLTHLMELKKISRRDPELNQLLKWVGDQEDLSPQVRTIISFAVKNEKDLTLRAMSLLKNESQAATLQEKVYLSLINDLNLTTLKDLLSMPDKFWAGWNKVPSSAVIRDLVQIYELKNEKLYHCAVKHVMTGQITNPQTLLSNMIFLNQENLDINKLTEEEWEKLSQEKLESCFKKVAAYEVAYKNTSYDPKDVELGSSIILTQIIAEMVIQENGVYNLGLISKIKDKLQGNSSFTKHLIYVLDALENNVELGSRLKAVDAPKEDNIIGCRIIRTSLGLQKDTPLKPHHAQRAIFSALLTNLRQAETVGSCAGTSRAIHIKHNLIKTVTLFDSIIKNNKLKLTSGKVELDTRFILDLNSKDLMKPFLFSPTGEISQLSNDGIYLWEVPGLVRLGNYLGIPPEKHKEWILKTLQRKDAPQKLCNFDPPIYFIDIRSFIIELIKDTAVSDREAFNVYLAEKQTPLDRILEAVIVSSDIQNEQMMKYAASQSFEKIRSMKLFVDEDGRLDYNNYNKSGLWKSKAIMAVLNVLEINKGNTSHQIVVNTIKRLKTEAERKGSPLRPITLRQLINALIETKGNTSEKLQKEAYEAFMKATPGFDESLLDQVTIEFFKEKRDDLLNPVNCLLFPDRSEYTEILEMLKGEAKLFDAFIKLYKKEIEDRFKVIYDHNFGVETGLNVHGKKTLIDLKTITDANVTKITTFDQWKDFCKQIVTDSLNKMNDPNGLFSKRVLQYVESPIFQDMMLRDFLRIYSNAHAGKEPLKNFDSLYEKPWELRSGAAGIQTWFYSQFTEGVTLYGAQYYPKNSTQLLKGIIEFWQFQGSKLPPDKRNGGNMPGHSISFIFGHPSLRPLWHSPDPWLWVEENMIAPAKVIGETLVDEVSMNHIVEKIKNSLPFYERDKFNISYEPLTYRKLRAKILETIATIKGSYNKMDDVEKEVDTKMMNLLPQNLLDATTVLHFADSNWLDIKEQKNCHFCFVQNPFNQELELWKVNEDGSKLSKCHNNEWFNSRQWVIFQDPEA